MAGVEGACCYHENIDGAHCHMPAGHGGPIHSETGNPNCGKTWETYPGDVDEVIAWLRSIGNDRFADNWPRGD